jgi:hypothetical protein
LCNPPEHGFKLTYYDANGNERGSITLIRSIEVKVMIDIDGDKTVDAEGRSRVRPRNI